MKSAAESAIWRYSIIIILIVLELTFTATNEGEIGSVSTIVTRAEWGAEEPIKPLKRMKSLPPSYVIISDTVTAPCESDDQCIDEMKNIQDRFFTMTRQDIGYNFLIGGNGIVYEGRGWDVIGYHTTGYNTKSIGIAFIGDYWLDNPTDEQISAALQLMNLGVRENKLSSDYKILAHNQIIDDASPGESLMNVIKTWKHWLRQPLINT